MLPASADHNSNGGFILFGGVCLQSYCKSRVYTFSFADLKSNQKKKDDQTKKPIKFASSWFVEKKILSKRHSKLCDEV